MTKPVIDDEHLLRMVKHRRSAMVRTVIAAEEECRKRFFHSKLYQAFGFNIFGYGFSIGYSNLLSLQVDTRGRLITLGLGPVRINNKRLWKPNANRYGRYGSSRWISCPLVHLMVTG